jgi:hypothetical protein
MAYADERPTTAGMMYEWRGVPELKALGAYLIKVSQEIADSWRGAKNPSIASKLPTRKAELIQWIQKLAQNDPFLEKYYDKLSHFEKAAVQEIVHSGKGILDFARFEAKYGEVPQTRPSSHISLFPSDAKGTRAKFPALSFLVASNGDMPPDLLSRLKKFVPRAQKDGSLDTGAAPGPDQGLRGKRDGPARAAQDGACRAARRSGRLAARGYGQGGRKRKDGKSLPIGSGSHPPGTFTRRLLSRGNGGIR